jgi:hypothetical protein
MWYDHKGRMLINVLQQFKSTWWKCIFWTMFWTVNFPLQFFNLVVQFSGRFLVHHSLMQSLRFMSFLIVQVVISAITKIFSKGINKFGRLDAGFGYIGA